VCSVVRSCFHELHSSFHAGVLGERLKQAPRYKPEEIMAKL
jgi:hypothetical protein